LKHKIWYDDTNDVLREKLIGSFTEDDVPEYLALMEKVYGECDHAYVIVDASEASQPFYEPRTREMLLEGSGKLHYFDEKVAFLKAKPGIRELIVEFIEALRLKGKPVRIRFFDDEAEALAWLKG
jgi:hypothetical protein